MPSPTPLAAVERALAALYPALRRKCPFITCQRGIVRWRGPSGRVDDYEEKPHDHCRGTGTVPVVTLDALLGVCRERGWRVWFDYDGEARLWRYDQSDPDRRFWREIGRATAPDPREALARALLQASEGQGR